MKKIYYIMGVSGCGKSTIGKAWADHLGIDFYDGDDFHPEANIEKMASGMPLDDDDRFPWLEAIRAFAFEQVATHSVVIACSALKATYREILGGGNDQVKFIHLQGSYNLIMNRLQSRNHFMPPTLLQSQFDTLELPNRAITIDINQSIERIILEIEKKESLHMKSEVGLVGLGIMGTSLSRNLASKGFRLSIFNRRVAGKEEGVARKAIERHDELKEAIGFEDLGAFVESIERPRKIILMITAGKAVDFFIDDIKVLLDEGDILVDGGNTFYKDTEARRAMLADLKIDWIGAGISGGEEGALRGPSIMPGGSKISVDRVLPILQKIAARDRNDEPCCTNVGKGASGHFVKMVHNGIEYAEMQLIAEVYDLLRYGNGMSTDEIADIFESWNTSELGSYLLEISIDILRKKEGGELILDQILDVASNKGTGSWTTSSAASLGVAVPTLTAALNARYISSDKTLRSTLSKAVQWPDSKAISADHLRSAYEVSRMLNHIQGFNLIATVSNEYNWEIDRSSLASIWMNGCIIRSELMFRIAQIPSEDNLFQALISNINTLKQGLGEVVSQSAKGAVSIPCMMASLAYLQSSVRAESAANMIQAQRDYFGAHTYKMKNDPNGPSHQTQWKI